MYTNLFCTTAHQVATHSFLIDWSTNHLFFAFRRSKKRHVIVAVNRNGHV